MAAAKKPTQSVEETVRAVLKAVALADGPLKLGGKGSPLGSGAAASLARSQLFHEERPLLTATGAAKASPVELTPAGFEQVAGDLPDEAVGPAAKRIAAGLSAAARVDFLTAVVNRAPLAAPDLVPLLEAASAEEKTEREARWAEAARRKQKEDESLAALERTKAIIEDRRTARIASLKKELEIEGAGGQTVTTAAPQAGLPRPQTPEDFDFRRQAARRLVSSWLEACRMGKAEARQFLETAIGNMTAIRQLGEEGERVPFDGARHKADRPVRDGETVTIARPGWVLDDERGEYLLAPAQVK
jgi:hypothetical protein